MKIIKTYDQLSKVKRNDLFRKNNNGDSVLRTNTNNKRYIISIARKLSTGFEDINLIKNPTKSQYRKAQRVIKEYYSLSTKTAAVKLPNKSNRKLYAEITGLPKTFKLYPVQLSNNKNKLKVITRKGKKKLKEVGEFVSYENFYFDNKEELALNPENQTNKLMGKIEKVKKVKQINIIVGNYTTNASYDPEFIADEIKRYSMVYSNFQDFVRGLQIATFNQQRKEKKNVKFNTNKNRAKSK